MLVPLLGTALVIACVAIAFLLILLHRRSATHDPLDTHPLWASFFGSGRSALVVCSDVSLAVLQDMTGDEVRLSNYSNASYRADIRPTQNVPAGILQDLAARRYTAIADVGILTRFYQIPGVAPDRVQFRFARDVLPEELKRDSAVLIGSAYSDPWVSMFTQDMNFVFRDDPREHKSMVVNRAPRPGELREYDFDQHDQAHTVYGVVALRPNLRVSGQILILEGTSMAGTEAAADFVLDDHLLLPFLSRVRLPDGRLPYFEVLLQSTGMNGSASQLRILGYRTSTG